MFNFRKQKGLVDASLQVRYLVDLTTPNLPTVESGRMSRRYNRTMEAVLAPWQNGKPEMERVGIGITADLCDNGIGILTSTVMDAEAQEDWVVGFWLRDLEMELPWYFHCRVRNHSGQIGKLKKYGLEIIEFLNSAHRKQTLPLDQVFDSLHSPMALTP